MGNNSSSYTQINSAIKLSADLLVTSLQKCAPKVYSLSQITLDHNSGYIEFNGIDLSQTVFLTTECTQITQVDQSVSQQVDQTMSQLSKSLTDSLGLGGSSSATAITNLTTQLSTAIKDNFVQNCAPHLEVSSTLDLSHNSGVIVNKQPLTVTQLSNTIVNCTQSSTVVNDLVDQLKQIVDQKASAETQGVGTVISNLLKALTSPLIILAIVAGIAIFFFGGQKVKLGSVELPLALFLGAVVIILIAVYLVLKTRKSQETKNLRKFC